MPTILDHRGNPIARNSDSIARGPRRDLGARYDAAETSEETRRHWAQADQLSARSANSAEVRQVLRSRARYEVANNSYCAGMVKTLASDLIGTGPRLQVQGPSPAANRKIETAFAQWARLVRLASKLRTLRRSRAVDGEGFALLQTNEGLACPVKLDLLTVEADQVSTPYLNLLDPHVVDGIRFDQAWNPIEYHLLESHPGDAMQWGAPADYRRIDAGLMLHWFRADRPGQYRGVPEITPSLNLYAQLRRYTLAVLSAAEVAADFAAVLYSELPPDGESADAEPFESLNIERRMMTTLPAGWKMSQFKAEQPTTVYKEFKREILSEAARALDVPYNVASGDSSSYNYSSSRLDYLVYGRSIEVERSDLEIVALDPLLSSWLTEAALTMRGIPSEAATWPHRWLWPGVPYIDPENEANATETSLRNFLTTFSEECRRQGVDPETRVQEIAAERDLFEQYDIALPQAWQATTPAQPNPSPSDSTDKPHGNDPSPSPRRNGAAARVPGPRFH